MAGCATAHFSYRIPFRWLGRDGQDESENCRVLPATIPKAHRRKLGFEADGGKLAAARPQPHDPAKAVFGSAGVGRPMNCSTNCGPAGWRGSDGWNCMARCGTGGRRPQSNCMSRPSRLGSGKSCTGIPPCDLQQACKPGRLP